MKAKHFVLPLTGLLLATPALANSYRSERRDCRADAMRLCRHEVPHVKRITLCMERHVKQLTPACRQHFGPSHHGRRTR